MHFKIWHILPVMASIISLSAERILIGITEDACEKSSNLTIEPIISNYGSLDIFYDISQSIPRALLSKIDNDFRKKIVEILEDPKLNIGDNLTFLLSKEVWLAVVFFIGIVFVFILPIFSLVFCCCRFCRHEDKDQQISKTGLIICLVCLTIILAFFITGIIIYSRSLQNTADNIDKLPAMVTSVTQDVIPFIATAAVSITCQVNSNYKNVYANLEKLSNDLEDEVLTLFRPMIDKIDIILPQCDEAKVRLENLDIVIDEFRAKIMQLKAIAKDDQDAMKEINTLKGATDEFMIEVNEVLEHHVNAKRVLVDVRDEIETIETKLNESQESFKVQLDSVSKSLSNILNTVNKSLIDIQEKSQSIKDYLQLTNGTFKENIPEDVIVIISYLIVLIPSIALAIFALIFLGCGIVRLLVKRNRKSSGCAKFTDCGRTFIVVLSIIIAIFFGWLIMLFSSLMFLFESTMEGVCQPIFYDPDFQLMQSIKKIDFHFSVPFNGSQTVIINPGEVLKDCREQNTLVKTIHGEVLINTDGILNITHFSSVKESLLDELSKIDFNLEFSEDLFNKLKDANILNSAQKVNLNMSHCQSINGTEEILNAMNNDFEKMVNQSAYITDKLKNMLDDIQYFINISKEPEKIRANCEKIINELFEKANKTLTGDLENIKSDILERSLNCRPIYEIWENIGALLCARLKRPLAGIWASLGLIAICILPIIVLLSIISRMIGQPDNKYGTNELLSNYEGRDEERRKNQCISAYNSPQNEALYMENNYSQLYGNLELKNAKGQMFNGRQQGGIQEMTNNKVYPILNPQSDINQIVNQNESLTPKRLSTPNSHLLNRYYDVDEKPSKKLRRIGPNLY